MVGTRVDIAEDEWFPFLANPQFNAGATTNAQLRARLDEAARPFLDDLDGVVDWHHFASRIGGPGAEADLAKPGSFCGRTPQLQRLGVVDHPAREPGLMLVIDSPGAGKSALLGLIVCGRTHPMLSEACRTLWWDRNVATCRPCTRTWWWCTPGSGASKRSSCRSAGS